MFGNQADLSMFSIAREPGMDHGSTSRCGRQCAVRVVPVPVGCFVEGILDIVHEPMHFRSNF